MPYSRSRLRFLFFNSYDELSLKDKIVYGAICLSFIIVTYIFPFGDWLMAHTENHEPLFEYVGEPTLDSILPVLFGVMWTANIAEVVVDLMALLVDMLIDGKQ